jgi:excisionase family DNA binding protein
MAGHEQTPAVELGAAVRPVETSAPASGPVWLTVREAAARARVSSKVIYRAAAANRLRHATVTARGDLRFRAAWVDAWVEACATP